MGCHMENGQGDPTQGAPKLTDAIGFYGGTREGDHETVHYARFGVLPNWNTRLSETKSVRFLSSCTQAAADSETRLPGPPSGLAGPTHRRHTL